MGKTVIGARKQRHTQGWELMGWLEKQPLHLHPVTNPLYSFLQSLAQLTLERSWTEKSFKVEGQIDRALRICLVCKVWTILARQWGITNASHALLSSDSRCPVSKQPQRRHTQICSAHCVHIYTHRYMALAILTHICGSSHSGSSRRHPTRYAELLLESVLASLGTSVATFLRRGQVTLQEARSGPKTATWYPAERAAHPRQGQASFTRPVTPQQCVGGFFYAMGEWNLSPAGSYWHLRGRWAGEAGGPTGEVEVFFVCAQ